MQQKSHSLFLVQHEIRENKQYAKMVEKQNLLGKYEKSGSCGLLITNDLLLHKKGIDYLSINEH